MFGAIADHIHHPPFAPKKYHSDGDELCVWRGSTAAQFKRQFHLILIPIEMEQHQGTGSGARNARIAVDDHRVLLVPIVSKGRQHGLRPGGIKTFLRLDDVATNDRFRRRVSAQTTLVAALISVTTRDARWDSAIRCKRGAA